jgi:hypothetical protein
MIKNPILNSIFAAIYITIVACIMFYGLRNAPPTDTLLAPMVIISLFTLSAAVMGYLFCYEPLRMYLEGQKKESLQFFLKTVASFAVITVVFMIVLFIVGTYVSDRNNVHVFSPGSDAALTIPLTVMGEARGAWYFEASFPVVLVDEHGSTIAQGIAQAQGNWMTTDFVPFTATLNYASSTASSHYSGRGTLIFKKDNPSGLAQNDAEVDVPVYVK